MSKEDRKFAIALLLDGKGGARELSDQEVEAWQPGDGLLWIDLNLTDKAARRWLTSCESVDDRTTAVLLAAETGPRSFTHMDGLVVVLRGINMNPGAVPDDMVAVRMWLQKDRIITSRRRRVLSIGDLRDALMTGDGPASSGEFLVSLVDTLAGRIAAAVENIDAVLDALAERLVAGDVESVRTDLGVARRQAAAIRRHLAPQRDAIYRIARAPAELLTEAEVFDLREEGDHLTRQIENLDLVRENALVAQEELMNRIAMEQNSRMYLLSVVAALFLPLTFVTGMLGMNVAGLPGTVNPNGFIISAALMVVLGIGLFMYFKYKRWI